MPDKSLEGKCYVTRCPYCKKWQNKSAKSFGKDTNNATCIYCRKKFDVKGTSVLVDCRQAPNIVAERNTPKDEQFGFKRARFKGGNK